MTAFTLKGRDLGLCLLLSTGGMYAGTIGNFSIPPCPLNLSFPAAANSCQLVAGFDTTMVTISVGAAGYYGVAKDVVDVFAIAPGSGEGWIDIGFDVGMEPSAFLSRYLSISIGPYSCQMGPEDDICPLAGPQQVFPDGETGWLPIPLGTPFEVELTASVSGPSDRPYSLTYIEGEVNFEIENAGGQLLTIADPPPPASPGGVPEPRGLWFLALLFALLPLRKTRWHRP
jgi:hypothetical protein